MTSSISLQLILKEMKIFIKSKLLFLLSLFVFIESYSTIIHSLNNENRYNTVFTLHQEALIRGTIFPLVIFLLLSGFILFSYFRRERLPEYSSIFFAKPIKTWKLVLSRFIAVTVVMGLTYFFSVLLSVIVAKMVLGLIFNLLFFLSAYLLIPFFSIVIWIILILSLTMITTDYRIALPSIFLLWFLVQVFPKSFLIEYHKVSISNMIFDNYILVNRICWLIIVVFFLCFSILIYKSYREGFKIKLPGFEINKKISQKDINLRNSSVAEIWYSIKIYSGWKVLVASFVSVILALIYSIFVPEQYRLFLYLGTGEIFLALLAILGTSGISLVEQDKGTKSLISSLPFAEKRLFKQKIIVALIYFLAVYFSYTIGGVLFIGTFIAGFTWILISTYIFFTTLALIFSIIFNSTSIGGMVTGIIWFLPIILGRRFPYWLHPYYYFAEFDRFNVNFLIGNKIILLVISILLIVYFLFKKNMTLCNARNNFT